ncbi:hypothetical protein LOD99_14900 [Oopsacas minuta]|uniref:Basic leucine zipper domain-containing protein n=1 Tax=Oopsacas minuta TaxID=111878 RepID=A0AAV7KCJ5_9METZ|nr:hypothetical protein LOD99_14900 [Oopsacas minuta]
MSDFEVLRKYGLNREEVVSMDIMALNTLLMEKLIPKKDIKELKSIRRRIKMRKYRNESSKRQKIELIELENERDNLLDEAMTLEEEIEEIKHKMAMIELLEILDKDFS